MSVVALYSFKRGYGRDDNCLLRMYVQTGPLYTIAQDSLTRQTILVECDPSAQQDIRFPPALGAGLAAIEARRCWRIAGSESDYSTLLEILQP